MTLEVSRYVRNVTFETVGITDLHQSVNGVLDGAPRVVPKVRRRGHPVEDNQQRREHREPEHTLPPDRLQRGDV